MFKLLVVVAFAAVAVRAFGDDDDEKPKGTCGLPPYTARLPADVQTKLTEIWKDYDEDDCAEQRKQTKEVIHKLPQSVRSRVFNHRGPKFLRGVSDEVRAQFDALHKDTSIAREDKPAKFEELAKKVLKGDNLKEFNKFNEIMKKRRNEFKTKVDKLSKEAKVIHEKLNALREEKAKLFATASDSVRDELFELYKGFHGRRGFGRRGGRAGRHGKGKGGKKEEAEEEEEEEDSARM